MPSSVKTVKRVSVDKFWTLPSFKPKTDFNNSCVRENYHWKKSVFGSRRLVFQDFTINWLEVTGVDSWSHTVIRRTATTVVVVGYTTSIFGYIRSRYYCNESLVSDIIMLAVCSRGGGRCARCRRVCVVCGGWVLCLLHPSAHHAHSVHELSVSCVTSTRSTWGRVKYSLKFN